VTDSQIEIVPVGNEQVTSLLGLLQSAVDKGIDVQALEKLTALYERMADRRASEEFTRDLAEFQRTCPRIPKSSTAKITTKAGGQFAYRYAELDTIAETVRPFLHALGFSYSWDTSLAAGIMSVVCTLRHANGHKESARFDSPIDDRNAALSQPQQHAVTLTFAKRQSLLQVLGLTTTEDDLDSGNGAAITADQARDLRAMIDELGIDHAKFCAYLGVDELEKLPASGYSMAVAALNAKRRAAGART
jgi:hypothetical protein